MGPIVGSANIVSRGGIAIMNEFEFVFRTEPRAIQSVRFCRIGEHVRTYQPKNNTDWKNYIRLCASEQLPEKWQSLDGPLALEVQFVFSPLRSFPKKTMQAIAAGNRVYKSTKPDLTDNLLKGLCDALTGICWRDDSQICKVNSCKFFGLDPMIRLKVSQIKIERGKEVPDLFS